MKKWLLTLLLLSNSIIYGADGLTKEMPMSLFLRKITSAYRDGMDAVENYKTDKKIESKYYVDDKLRICSISPTGALESFLADFGDSYVYYAYYGDDKNKDALIPMFLKLKTEFQRFMDKNKDFTLKEGYSEYSIIYKSDYFEVELDMYENSNLPDGTWCVTLNIDAF